jgi:DNA-binding transcriptional ArsR family regulator
MFLSRSREILGCCLFSLTREPAGMFHSPMKHGCLRGDKMKAMDIKYPISSVAELLADPARAGILVALLDGRALPAGGLAMIARVSAQSASAHLSKLVDGWLLHVQSEGRHRYYRIASPEVGHALEALGTISTKPNASRILRWPDAEALHAARSCYDHLAGRVAVELTKTLESAKILAACGARDYEIGRQGARWFAEMGIDVRLLQSRCRSFARQCLDWTERTPHVAGALGAAPTRAYASWNGSPSGQRPARSA